MKHFEIDIQNATVTTNGQTCNFYEAGLYEVGPNNSTVNLTDPAEIKEVLSEQYDDEEIEIEFV